MPSKSNLIFMVVGAFLALATVKMLEPMATALVEKFTTDMGEILP